MQQGNIESIEVANEIIIPEIIHLLNEGHTATFRVKGFSMRPFLESNCDSVLLAKAENPKVGDAVLAEIAPKRYVLHRLIAIDGDNATLRGDGNLSNEYCKVSDIHGIALGFYRKGRETLDSTDGKKWKRYSYIWTRLYPVRRYLLAIYRRMIKYKLYKP